MRLKLQNKTIDLVFRYGNQTNFKDAPGRANASR